MPGHGMTYFGFSGTTQQTAPWLRLYGIGQMRWTSTTRTSSVAVAHRGLIEIYLRPYNQPFHGKTLFAV